MTSPRKFRVWDGEEMHEPPHQFLLGSAGEVYHHSSVPRDEEKVMFTTDLTDEEDTEIYEKDILKSRTYGWQVKVKWFKKNARFYLTHWGDKYHLEGCNDLKRRVIKSSDYVVIGNRYENPEL